jgi:hypothetical protein
MSVSLERAMFTFSRAKEYFDARELQSMTGQPIRRFPEVVLKELIDNALDAAEAAGVAPRVSVRLCRRGRLLVVSVHDNGPGIPPETVEKLIDFQTRSSERWPTGRRPVGPRGTPSRPSSACRWRWASAPPWPSRRTAPGTSSAAGLTPPAKSVSTAIRQRGTTPRVR